MSEFLTGFNEINSMVQTTTSNVEYSTVSEEVESYLEVSFFIILFTYSFSDGFEIIFELKIRDYQISFLFLVLN